MLTSSSGGGFIAIAKYVPGNGGIVYGAAYQGCLVVAIEKVETIDGLEQLKDNKYVLSDTRDVYSQVKRDLSDGRLVHFKGTHSQIVGLRFFSEKAMTI